MMKDTQKTNIKETEEYKKLVEITKSLNKEEVKAVKEFVLILKSRKTQ